MIFLDLLKRDGWISLRHVEKNSPFSSNLLVQIINVQEGSRFEANQSPLVSLSLKESRKYQILFVPIGAESYKITLRCTQQNLSDA